MAKTRRRKRKPQSALESIRYTHPPLEFSGDQLTIAVGCDLPRICMRTGRTGECVVHKVSQNVAYVSPLTRFIVGVSLAPLFAQREKLTYWLSNDARRGELIGQVTAALSILSTVTGIVLMAKTRDLTWFVFVVAGLVGMLLSAPKVTHFRVVKVDGTLVTLSLRPEVVVAFREHITASRAGAQQPQLTPKKRRPSRTRRRRPSGRE